MNIETFTRKFYIFRFFFEFSLTLSIGKLFLLYRGLDLMGIAVILAVSSILMIIFEVPSGAIADKWDKKKVLIVAGTLRILSVIIWVFSTNLPMFITGSAFLVAGYSLESGTLQAYIFDILKTYEKEDDFEKIWGRGSAVQQIGMACAMALGGFLSTYSYEWAIGLSATGPFLAILIIVTFPNDPKQGKSHQRKYFSILVNGLKNSFRSGIFLRIFLHSAIVLAGFGVMEQYRQVLLADRLSLSNTYIGIFLAISVGLGSIGSVFAHRLKEYSWKILFAITGATVLLSAVIVFTQSWAILLVLVIFNVFHVITWILLEGIVQRTINSEERATITSINSFVTQIGVTTVSLIFGTLSNSYGIHIGYGFYGALFLIYSVVSLFLFMYKKVIRSK